MHRRSMICIAAFALITGRASAQSTAAPPAVRVVTTAWLEAHLKDTDLAVIEIGQNAGAPQIPGAHAVNIRDLVVKAGNLAFELPPAGQLRTLFEQAGVSDSTLVVFAGETAGPIVARALLSLDYLGHSRLAILDGGTAAWRSEGRAVGGDAPRPTPGHITTRVRTDKVVDAQWISARLGKPGLALIDTRTDGEYLGSGDRHGMPSEGHLPGARQLQWEELFKNPESGQLKSRAELAKLYADRMHAGDTVVTYCWIGQRASMTYVAARILGLPAKFYDGSYQDWQQQRLPVVAGARP
jgi:thiosulfate/3-mercaptopyruvate sulfurtransferase